MRILVNFVPKNGGYAVHCIAEDARTLVGGWTNVSDQPTLTKMLRYAGATDDEIAEAVDCLRRWSHGSTFLTLKPGQKNLLCIASVHAKPLGLW